MQGVVNVIRIVLPVLVAFGLGYLCRVKKLLDIKAVEGLKSLALNFALPAMLFGAFFLADYSTDILVTSGTMFAMGCLGLGTGFLIARVCKKSGQLVPFMTSGWENGAMGYPLYVLLFGAGMLQNISMFELGQVLFLFLVYLTVLNLRGGGLKASLVSMIKSPVPWAIALGVICGATGLTSLLAPSGAASVITSVCDFIASPLSCVMLFVLGYGISFNKRSLAAALRLTALRLVVCGVLCVLMLLICSALLDMTRPLFWAIVLISVTPAPFVLPLYVVNETERADISVCLSLQTLVTVAAFIVIAAIVL